MKKVGNSPVLVDAKALFDVVLSLAPGLKLSEKRTAIEVAIMRDRLQAMGGKLKWLNSSQQLADGLTKVQGRDQMNYLLMKGIHRLTFDPNYTAAKKVKKEDKEMEKEEMEAASKEIYEGQIFEVSEDADNKENKCALAGCFREVDNKEAKHKYCSRRHFYLDFHRKNGNSDQWKKVAMGAVATLSLAEIPTAEASRTSHEETFFTDIKMLFTIAVIVVFAGYGIVEFVKNTANVLIVKLKDVVKNDEVEVPENLNARPSHVAGDYLTDENEAKTSENKAVKVMTSEKGTGTGAASSTDSTNAKTMMEEKPREVTWPQPERDEYSRQTGIREDPVKGNQIPRVSPESQTFGTPEYFEMTT